MYYLHVDNYEMDDKEWRYRRARHNENVLDLLSKSKYSSAYEEIRSCFGNIIKNPSDERQDLIKSINLIIKRYCKNDAQVYMLI